MFRLIDVARSQKRRRDRIDADAPLRRAFLELEQFVNRRQLLVRRFRHAADVLDPMAGEELQPRIRGWPALTPEFHQRAFAPLRRIRRLRRSWKKRASR